LGGDPDAPHWVTAGGNADASTLNRALDTHGGAGQRSVGEWVRTAQAMLRTPRKQSDAHAKTPEDSAKKKRRRLQR